MQLKEESAKLSPFAVETRYPDFETPSLQDAVEAVKISKRIKRYILSKLPWLLG